MNDVDLEERTASMWNLLQDKYDVKLIDSCFVNSARLVFDRY